MPYPEDKSTIYNMSVCPVNVMKQFVFCAIVTETHGMNYDIIKLSRSCLNVFNIYSLVVLYRIYWLFYILLKYISDQFDYSSEHAKSTQVWTGKRKSQN